MATEIKKWLATDGREFNKEIEAKAHEAFLLLIPHFPKNVPDLHKADGSSVYHILTALLRSGVIISSEGPL